MATALEIPVRMTLAEFLVWNPSGSQTWQLVDGEPQAMALANRTHGAIQGEFGALIGNHLHDRGGPCSVVIAPGVIPRVQANTNIRVPDLAVTCSPYAAEEAALTEPNVWAYTSIPSVQEILIVQAAAVGAELLRRAPDATWPAQPEHIETGELFLCSIDFRISLAALYRTTRLAPA